MSNVFHEIPDLRCQAHPAAVKLTEAPERSDQHVWIDLWNGWWRCGGPTLWEQSPEAEARRGDPVKVESRWELRHRSEALQAFQAGDSDSAWFHLSLAEKLRFRKWREGQMPTSSLGEPAIAPDPEASEFVSMALAGVELGLLRWDATARDWIETDGRVAREVPGDRQATRRETPGADDRRDHRRDVRS